MKKFIIRFFLFLLPVFILMGFADAFISENLKKSNEFVAGEYSTWNALYNKKLDSKIIVLGSSRAWLHFDAAMMTDSLKTPVYNIGMDGYNFWFQDYRLKLAMQSEVKPKLIVHSVDVFTLAKRPDLFYPEQFLPYMLGNEELHEVSKGFSGFTDLDYRIPMLRYFGKGKALIESFKMASNGKNEAFRISGFHGNEEAWNNDLAIAEQTVGSMTVKIDAPTVQLFEAYLERCRKENIQIVFVNAPEYIEGQDFIANRKMILETYRKYSAKYDIPFLDYSTDPLSYNKQLFYNSLHMNKIGAEIFTAKFIGDLKKLGLTY
jgi:hypothetical protein